MFLVFLFSEGIFSFFGFANIYKAILFLISVLLFIIKSKNHFSKKKALPSLLFITTTVLLFISTFTNYNSNSYNFFQIFSQYSKFATPFLLLYYFISQRKKLLTKSTYNIINALIILQIILSVWKLIIIGTVEAVVGSIAYTGGHYATLFPILAFVYYWIIKNNKFNRFRLD